MKQIITLDKANQPYGFAQLDGTGTIPSTIAVAGTASYATSASIASSATTSISASYATSASIAATAVYAENGTQWTDTNLGIQYDAGSEVKLGSGANPGILTTAYNTNGYYGGYVDNAGDFDTLFAACPIITQSVYPNIDNISRNSDYYALKFEGYLTVPTSDTYTFGLDSDDASDAFIDNTLVADWYGGHGGNSGPGGNQTPIVLSAGRHPLVVRFQEVSGGDFVTLYYKTGSMSWTIVPDEWYSYGGGNVDLIITGSLGVSGSVGSLVMTGSQDYILSIHGENDAPWAFGLYNDTYNVTQSVFAGWIGDSGESYIGNEVDTPINIYANADYFSPILQISSSGVSIINSLSVSGSTLLSGSTIIPSKTPNNFPSGSTGDKKGMVAFDNDYVYYCTEDFVAPIVTHVYDRGVTYWNGYHDPGTSWLQTGPSEESGGTLAPQTGWYFIDDTTAVRQLTSESVWFGGQGPAPAPNGDGWLCSVDNTAWSYDDNHLTLTMYESYPTGLPSTGAIWKRTPWNALPSIDPVMTGSVNISGSLTLNNVSGDLRPYKVYTALLTQSGGSSDVNITSGELVIGRTYNISAPSSGDFTNVGAPNNNEGTWFVATGTTPNSWGTSELYYNTGAPVVTVLENTIGDVWFQYNNTGYYSIFSDSLFSDKTWCMITMNYNGISDGYISYIYRYNADEIVILTGITLDGSRNNQLDNTPIEIRVYN
jgi:hypothetical protein